ncbi:MAG: hypothetical protein P8076_16060, partial [Gammaproteobacteria bacterium]
MPSIPIDANGYFNGLPGTVALDQGGFPGGRFPEDILSPGFETYMHLVAAKPLREQGHAVRNTAQPEHMG